MLRWLLRRKLDAEEERLGESMDYLRHVVDVSPIAFLRFASIMPFASSRKALPAGAWYTAQLVAIQHEDCGPCLQITINLAQQHAVEPELIQAVLDGRTADLSQELADVYAFAESVVSANDDGGLRSRIKDLYGERGVIELAFAIASARVPPTVKRALGYAKSCSIVETKS